MILMLNILFFTLLISNLADSQAATRGFNKGDIILWGIESSYSRTYSDLNASATVKYEEYLASDLRYNLIEVDTIAKTFDANATGPYGRFTINDEPYDAVTFGIDNLNLLNVLDVSYAFDYDTNTTRLYAFDFFIDFRMLLEPNWATINSDFVKMFNESEIVATVVDPWEPIENPNNTLIYNNTLENLFSNSTSFTIMNVKNNLANAKTKFTALTTKWTFNFDFSEYLCERIQNKADGNYTYYPLDIATISLSGYYSEGGIAERLNYKTHFKTTLPGEIFEIESEMNVVIGGIRSATADYSYLLTIPVFIGISSLFTIIRKRK